MKIKIVVLLVSLMLLATGCNDEKYVEKNALQEMSNIEKAEYYLKLAEDTHIINHARYYQQMADSYMLKEAVEKGITVKTYNGGKQ